MKSIDALGTLSETERDLVSLGWTPADANRLKANLRKALNHAAYVLQTLRSGMGDVHGTKPTLKPLVFNALKWATLIVGLLKP